MENYRPIYRFIVEHGYFKQNTCRSIQVRLSPLGQELMKRREDNEWITEVGMSVSSNNITDETNVVSPSTSEFLPVLEGIHIKQIDVTT
ncbi:hypothetical protein D0T53_03500 [Dysgonomonas sp. 216]|uniref:hypothetical protein n=1 Tax=Dysgonomonas sp. 216 TaxID=2302934 RepID=UPI0013D47D2F|nr:hypothetical protein [Dysgonomonas sp. 216]NDW17981.1 hypothetical protein [Dysgonomonas sp. 216]